MALRTEQTTMGRATDPKEQRRSAKRGRGQEGVLSAHRRSGTQTTMGLRELGRKGRAKGGDGGTFIAGCGGGEGRRGRVYVRIAGGSTPVCSAQVGASQSQGGFWGPLGGRRADGPLV